MVNPSPPPHPIRGGNATFATGKQLLNACWRMLRQDRALLWLPAIAAISAFFAALILFAPGFAIGWFAGGDQHHSWGGWVGGVFAAFAASVVSIYFQAALVIGANQRADGLDPTVRGVLAEAWTHKGKILGWALVTTSVGVAIRALEQRVGILANLLGVLGGLAWAVVSFLVVPVIVAEDVGPIEAIKRSSHILKQTWGTSLRTTLRFSILRMGMLLLPIAVIALGVFAATRGSNAGLAVGIVLIVLGVVVLLALAMIFSAIFTYARALIYRYATGRPVPGIDPNLLGGAFRQKGPRRGFV